jgi:hypothetical protein
MRKNLWVLPLLAFSALIAAAGDCPDTTATIDSTPRLLLAWSMAHEFPPDGAVLQSYTRYYNELRTHRSLNKDAPIHRATESLGPIISQPVLGGLQHHQYCRI